MLTNFCYTFPHPVIIDSTTHLEDFRSSPITVIQWLWRLVQNTRTLGTQPRTNTTLYSCLGQPFYAKPHGVFRSLFVSLTYKTAVGTIQQSDLPHVTPSNFLAFTKAILISHMLAIIYKNKNKTILFLKKIMSFSFEHGI